MSKSSNAQKQCAAVLAHLQAGNKITPLDALRFYGIGRLAARIDDLKKKCHTITKKMVDVRKGDGTMTKVAEYAIVN